MRIHDDITVTNPKGHKDHLYVSVPEQHILNIPEGWAGDHVTGNDFSKIVESPAKQNKEGANFQKLIIESKGNVRRI